MHVYSDCTCNFYYSWCIAYSVVAFFSFFFFVVPLQDFDELLAYQLTALRLHRRYRDSAGVIWVFTCIKQSLTHNTHK